MKRRPLILGLALAFTAGLAAIGLRPRPRAPLTPEAFAALYSKPLAPPAGPLRVFHLGHSLVGRDMPAMLAQLARPGHRHASQLGWGASLHQHWQGERAISGFAQENAHPAFRPAHAALASGQYDALVLTEMVEIRDAIRYHDSARFLAHWARKARRANPAIRICLYETWHWLDDPEGWLTRLDRDLARYWEAGILRPAMAQDGVGVIHVIPAGQVLARLVRQIEAAPLPGLARREDLFGRDPQGGQDPIHLGDLGAYLVALTHYAVLTHRDPRGLPHQLLRADDTPATAPSPEAAQVMQQVVWDVVTSYGATGIAAPSGG